MKYIEFDESRPMDLVLLGRVAIDFNPAYNDQVKEEFKPLKKVHMFEKFVGGSPANIAVGVTKHGLKIPVDALNYAEFSVRMKTCEQEFKRALIF